MQNLEIKKLTDEKKDALASQYAAEATLRRVHANQKDEDFTPIETAIAPLEAEIKMYRNEVQLPQFPTRMCLQGNNKIEVNFRMDNTNK